MKSKGLGEKVKKSDQPGKVYHDQRKNAPEINKKWATDLKNPHQSKATLNLENVTEIFKKCYLILKSGTLTKKAIDFALKSYSDLKKIINFLKTLTILISKSVAGVFKKRPRPKRPLNQKSLQFSFYHTTPPYMFPRSRI